MNNLEDASSRRKVVRWLVAVVLVLNVALWVWKSQRPPQQDLPTATDQMRRQEKILVAWNSPIAVPIVEIPNLHLQKSVPHVPCFSVPSEGQAVIFSKLPSHSQSDLEAAVVGLVKAVSGKSGEEFLGYMKGRRKVFSSKSAKSWRNTLVEDYQYSLSKVTSMSDDEMFLAAWKAMEVSSHWTGLVLDESCWTLWKTASIPASEMRRPRSITDALFADLKEMRSWRNHFFAEGDLDLEEVVDRGDELYVADVRIIVEHDSEHLQQRAPYLVRFWFHPDLMRWQPIIFARVGSFDNAPVTLTF